MLKLPLVIIFLTSSLFSYAEGIRSNPNSATETPVPGSSTESILTCDSLINSKDEPLVGSMYSLKCKTAALPPRYSLQSCVLVSKAVSPTAIAKVTKLMIEAQSESMAFLKAKNAKVLFNKVGFSADVLIGDALGSCQKSQDKLEASTF